MSKFLWDLNIEDIPCGFESIYQDALIDCPNGKMVKTFSCDSTGTTISACEYNPVEYRKIIINEFNKFKTQAIEIFNNRNSLDFKECCNELLKIDTLLYSLISEWTCTSDIFCDDEFQPQFISNHIKNISLASYFDDADDEYNQFKLINLYK